MQASDKKRRALLIANKCHELGASGQIGFENAAHGTGGAGAGGISNAPDGHARMAGFENDADATGAQLGHEKVGKILGHTFLDLRAVRQDLLNARNLAQAYNLTLREISNMSVADE